MTVKSTEGSDSDGKSIWRSRLLTARRNLSPTERSAADAAIQARLLTLLRALPREVGETAVALYWPVRGEVDLTPLLPKLRELGWTPALPRVTGPREMVFAVWSEDAALVRGRFGIPEPPPSACVIPPNGLAAVVVPGLGFAHDGTRLGFGAGYYDAWLNRPGVRAVRIGVCYECQRVPHLPSDPWDVPMQWVITEAGAWRCGASA
ncbi:MAG: 5-formyltetrahydrofolate cyclo-ligase [Thermoflavifilum sp.]|nr:5-formyltetrahydrofolate cyclo-ligase [Thermoflavifilum sp.]MCL6513673.1 5-formyltetrahydrofolate cyclo-ligase [Alicyclobacillus sp.]